MTGAAGRLACSGSIALGLAAALSAAAQNVPPLPPQGQQPVFRAGASFVLVDAYPQKDGRIVEGLKAADFQVFEDGKPQTIENFEFVRVEGNLPESARRDPEGLNEMREIAADPHNRVFVTFLDTRHTTVDGSHNIRLPLVSLLERIVGPNDLFGVMTENMRPQDLTLGRKTVAIDGMLEKYWTWGERQRLSGRDPDDQGETDLTNCFRSRWTGREWVDWIVDDGPVRRFLDEVLIDRRREDMTFKALEALVAYLPQIRESRTAVIVVTDGWLLYQRDGGLANEPGKDARTGDPNERLPRIGDTPFGRSAANGPNYVAWPTCLGEFNRLMNLNDPGRFTDLMRAANRGNISIYPVTARGLQAFDGAGAAEKPAMRNPNAPPGMTQLVVDQDRLFTRVQNLRTLAENTDGIAIVQTNDLTGGMKRIADDVSAYYLLGYYTTNTKADGKLRKIEVKMAPPGLTIHARRGYLGPTATARPTDRAGAVTPAAAPVSAAVDAAVGALSRLRESAESYLYAAPSAKDLAVVVELSSRQMASGAWTGGGDVRIDVAQENGARVATATGKIEAGGRSALVRVPATLAGATLQVSAHLSAGGVSLDDRILVTPGSNTLIGEPLLYRAATRPRAPLKPVADFQLHRTERAHVEWPILKPLDNRAARLLDRRGQPLAINVTVTERDADGTQVVAADMNLAPLSDGDYVVELIAGSGGATERTLLAIRVIR